LIMLVRHAQAGERDPARYPDDADRPLTGKGKVTQAEVGEALRKRGLIPDAILSSPWKRAWQTAEILGNEIAGKKAIKPIATASLAEAPDLQVLGAEIANLGEVSSVALVGHEPWMGELASLLLAGDPDRVAFDFPKSGVIGIDAASIEAGAGVLRFFLRPKLLTASK
jgi:phosphohistidine phosphatase